MSKNNEQKLNIPKLGVLTLHDVLDFYDIPLVFITRDIFDTLYLFLVTIQNSEQTEWLVTKISKTRYLELKYNKISLQTAYKNSETNNYYLVSDFNNGQTTITEHISLPEGKLTEYENFVGEDIEIIPGDYNTLENAQKKNRNTLDIITKSEFNEFGMDGKQLRDTIDSFIGILSTYGIPDFNVKMIEGSTIIRCEFNDEYNLLDPISSTKPLKHFTNLLEVKNDDDISNNLENKISSLEKYDVFLRNIGKNPATLIQIASPNDIEAKTIHMNSYDIQNRRASVKRIIETKVTEFEDNYFCFAFDMEKKKIGFIFENDKVYADITNVEINPNQETGNFYQLKGKYKMKFVNDQIKKTDFKVEILEKKA